MKFGSLVLCVSILAASAAAQAQAPAPSPEVQAARAAVRQSCGADMKSMCGDKQGHEAMVCLREHSDKVSAGCKDAMAKLPKPAAPASK